jgi:hypothetical protein
MDSKTIESKLISNSTALLLGAGFQDLKEADYKSIFST